MNIYCCECCAVVQARLTNAEEIYPHREDLKDIPFWICNECKNYVGCHHKTANSTKPLGNIPTKALRNARNKIHKIFDPIWKEKKMSRSSLYFLISERLGYVYHTAYLTTIEEARKVYRIILEIRKELGIEDNPVA